MERQIIQLENFPDQAGIAVALRRAFAERRAPAPCADDEDSDRFAALLKNIH